MSPSRAQRSSRRSWGARCPEAKALGSDGTCPPPSGLPGRGHKRGDTLCSGRGSQLVVAARRVPGRGRGEQSEWNVGGGVGAGGPGQLDKAGGVGLQGWGSEGGAPLPEVSHMPFTRVCAHWYTPFTCVHVLASEVRVHTPIHLTCTRALARTRVGLAWCVRGSMASESVGGSLPARPQQRHRAAVPPSLRAGPCEGAASPSERRRAPARAPHRRVLAGRFLTVHPAPDSCTRQCRSLAFVQESPSASGARGLSHSVRVVVALVWGQSGREGPVGPTLLQALAAVRCSVRRAGACVPACPPCACSGLPAHSRAARLSRWSCGLVAVSLSSDAYIRKR